MDIVEKLLAKEKEKKERDWQKKVKATEQRLKILLICHPELVKYGVHQDHAQIFLDVPNTTWIRVKGSVIPMFVTHNGFRVIETLDMEKAILTAHRALGVYS